MEHRITLSVAKIVACILIVSLAFESVATAPLADNQQTPTVSKELNVGKEKVPKGVKRNNHRANKLFTQKEYEAWTNPCNADSFEDSSSSAPLDPTKAYNTVELNVEALKQEIIANDKINITNYEAWDEFNAEYYKFLPTHPSGNHRQWHFDLQVYVASFGLLYKYQYEEDKNDNNNTISTELKNIYKEARHLLCEIEGFVNMTSSQKIGSDDWIKKKEMRQLLQFQNLTDVLKLHQIYVKGRFQSYIERLLQRIKQQSKRNYVEKAVSFPKHKSLSLRKKKTVTRRPHKGARRVNGENKRPERPLHGGSEQNVEMVTKRVHILRTSRMPGRNSNRLNMGKGRNANGRRRQRTTKAAMLKQQKVL